MVRHKENLEFSNNLVAQSDYEAALQAISSTFDAFALRSQRDAEGDGSIGDEKKREIDHRFVEEIYETAKKSMMKNLERIVRPIADCDYQDYVDQYHIVCDDDDGDDGIADMVDLECDAEGDDEEIDEEELLDRDAWNSARSLREKVRVMSGSVQEIRERILEQTAKNIIETSLRPHLDDKRVIVSEHGHLYIGDGSEVSNGDALDKENNFVHGSKSSSNHSQALNDSLQALSQVLENPQWKHLPQGIQSLTDTIEAIRKETSENRVLSKVELAIHSRTNDMHDSAIQEAYSKLIGNNRITTGNFGDCINVGVTASECSISAVDRLALLGQLYP